MKNFTKLIAVVAALGFIGGTIHDSYAGSGTSKGGGSSSSGSSGSSSRSNSGGSSYSKPSSSGGGYSKPSSSPSSGSHSTSPSNSGSHSAPSAPSTPSNSGYSKPSSAPTTAPAPSQHTTPSATQHATPTTTQAPSSSQGYSKPTTAPTADVSKPANTQAKSTLNAASTKNMSADSLKAYQAERATASKPPQPVNKSDAVNNPARSTYKNTNDYMNNRTTVVKNYYNNNPGLTGFNNGMHPNYGIWDSSFLTGMIMGYVGSSLVNSMWMYSHMNEPWYRSYRADLDAQAANNADLKSKVAAMDAEIARLKAENAIPQKTNTLPAGIDPALAIAPEAMMAAEEQHEGMSWGWALGFFSFGLAAAFIAIKLFSKG